MTKQLCIFDYQKTNNTRKKYGRTSHGGAKSKGHRKEYRPLHPGKWHHLVLKSQKAKGLWSFLLPKNAQIVNETLKEKAKRWGITISEVVNVGNHLHIKCKFSDRTNFQNFLRSTTSLIARRITKSARGRKLSSGFWQGLAFTRVIKTKYEELQLTGYFKANRIQAKKGEEARTQYLTKFNAWVYRLRSASG